MERIQQDRPDSPVSSSVSMKSDQSMGGLTDFKGMHNSSQKKIQQDRPDSPVSSSVSMESDQSMGGLIDFKGMHNSSQKKIQQDRPDSPVSSSVSMESDQSMGGLIDFKGTHDSLQKNPQDEKKEPDPPDSESVSGHSKGDVIDLKHQDYAFENKHIVDQEHTADLESTFRMLEENISMFVKKELKTFQEVLRHDPAEDRVEKRVLDREEEEEHGRSERRALLKITLQILRKMKQEELADCLQSKTVVPMCQEKLKSHLKGKFQCIYEGTAESGKHTVLNDIYTELYITEGGSGGVNDEHEVRQIETISRRPPRPETLIRCEDIFQPGADHHYQPIRTVLTKGVAGIGKTVLTHKFSLDWAEDKTNHSVQFTFPFTFRELNLLAGKEYSLVGLVHLFFPETKEAEICSFDKLSVVFILDGLDECRFPLDFHSNQILTEVTAVASVDALLTNLISGNLLPSARLWITCRPAAANQIPAERVDRMTEVRGFTDAQKEEFFRRRFPEEEQASRIISHVKASRSLHIMCHIPVFCWVTASVLDHVLRPDENADLPKTLTEMYIHFLVVQCKVGNVKYRGAAGSDPLWSPASTMIIMSLGRLAFEHLQRGNLIFYESDLRECDLDVRAASVYSGLFTQIFKEECGLHQDKVFCFVHLSVQEFLAALYVFVTFVNTRVDLLSQSQSRYSRWPKVFTLWSNERTIFQTAVDKALQSPNGHLDLFLRFLVGLSVETNQVHLQGLLQQTASSSATNRETVKHIKEKIQENPSPERCINLFHCLNELNDHSLVEEIQQCLSSGSLSMDHLSPAQWSALVFILLSSEKDLEVFDLQKYSASEEGLLRLLPVVHVSRVALLSGCNLSERSCEALASVLRSKSSALRELDLSSNDVGDAGVRLLSAGLGSPHCRLEALRLSGCRVTEEGCAALASTLWCNPAHLTELDLSYNHPGQSGQRLLSAAREDPRSHLTALSVEHGGARRLRSGQRKYACDLTLDPNTVNSSLLLSEDLRQVSEVPGRMPYPEHPDRFHHWKQVLCREALAGRCYWEVEWRGWVNVGVAYGSIRRKGQDDDCWIGQNDKSWSLMLCDNKFSACHRNRRAVIPSHSSQDSGRVGVYLDWPAGRLSFYRVSQDTLTHIHTFHCTFAEPLHPAFGIELKCESTVSLCHM